MIASHRLLSPALVLAWVAGCGSDSSATLSDASIELADAGSEDASSGGETSADVAAPDSPGDAVAEPEPIPDAVVVIDMAHPAGPVNRGILGNATEWYNQGDCILKAGTLEFDSEMLDLLRPLQPSTLRYPGGSLSDFYQWQAGVGALADRQMNPHYDPSAFDQKVTFGTVEFLRLCRELGAEPLLTTNVVTASAADAAGWVHYVNHAGLQDPAGNPLAHVTWWEIGNEPYSRGVQTEYALEPEEFGSRANAMIQAMRAADPDIKVGVPLRSDRIGSGWTTDFAGYNDRLLGTLTEAFDFAAVHNAYFPVTWVSPQASDRDVYLATVAGALVVEKDLDDTVAELALHAPGKSIPFAITEFNTFYTQGDTMDAYVATPGSAVAIADLLRFFATRADLLWVNFWSLSGNWYFGAVNPQKVKRPAYLVLEGFAGMLQGELVPLAVSSPSLSNIEVGYVPAHAAFDAVTSLATLQGNVLRVVLINKSPEQALATELQAGGAISVAHASVRSLQGGGLFDWSESEQVLGWKDLTVNIGWLPAVLTLEPHSITFVELELEPGDSG